MKDTANEDTGEGSSQRDERAGISQAGDSIAGLSESVLPSPTPIQRRLIVALKGSADFRSIQAAIDAAAPGDVVVVKPGIYREGLLLEKPLELLGDGPVGNIIVESDNKPCLTVKTDSASVMGLFFRLTRLAAGKTSAIQIVKGEARIVDCIIAGGCNIDGGFVQECATKAVLIRCQFQKTQPLSPHRELPSVIVQRMGHATILKCQIGQSPDIGILVTLKGEATIEGCEFCKNKRGIEIRENGKATIQKCKIRNSRFDGSGILVKLDGEATIEGCDIFQNEQSGVCIEQKGKATIQNCKIQDNNKHGIQVVDGTMTIESCDINANRCGI